MRDAKVADGVLNEATAVRCPRNADVTLRVSVSAAASAESVRQEPAAVVDGVHW